MRSCFRVPTYLFVGTLLITIAVGIFGLFSAAAPHQSFPCSSVARDRGCQLLATAEGFCQRLHGIDRVEAVSNGVKAFREPAVKNAQRALTVIIFLLACCWLAFPIW